MVFEYDPNKSADNKRRHGIDFDDAQRLWADPGSWKFQPVHRMNLAGC
jgi:uncharacterized DUF497 family protein